MVVVPTSLIHRFFTNADVIHICGVTRRTANAKLSTTIFCHVEATRATLVAMPKLRRMIDTPLAERPREKLQRQGAAALSDFELLELLVGAGAGKTDLGLLARRLQRLLYKHGGSVTFDQLSEVNGVNIATAG